MGRPPEYFTINGETHTLTEWAAITEITRVTLAKRAERGLEGEDLIASPKHGNYFVHQHVEAICKKCVYRRTLGSSEPRAGDWSNTACHYCIDNNRLRDGQPTEDYCPNFKQRTTPDDAYRREKWNTPFGRAFYNGKRRDFLDEQ